VSARPSVSVIVPFAGSPAQLDRLIEVLERLELEDEDEVLIALNRPHRADAAPPAGRIQIISATGLRSPGFARNQAAAVARGQWLVFIDADTVPVPALLNELFRPAPVPGTAVLAGEIRDVAETGGLVARHAVARRQLSQTNTLNRGRFAYAQTANCAVRGDAFAAVGGFAADARAGEDADLCFRLAASGWEIEHRPRALVRHHSRDTARAWLRQLLLHGAGAAWLGRRYPGALPAPGPRALTRRLTRSAVDGARGLARADREAFAFALLDLTGALAFELGRRLPNSARREPGFTGVITGEIRPERMD
jgi:GT2 family glycosyltransferase